MKTKDNMITGWKLVKPDATSCELHKIAAFKCNKGSTKCRRIRRNPVNTMPNYLEDAISRNVLHRKNMKFPRLPVAFTSGWRHA